jgi:hypothetical protein
MDQLPQLPEQRPSPLVRAAAYLLVPVLGLIALPLILLIILVIYLLALLQGGRVFVMFLRGKTAPPDIEVEVKKPHFLEMQSPAKTLPDQATSPLESDPSAA